MLKLKKKVEKKVEKNLSDFLLFRKWGLSEPARLIDRAVLSWVLFGTRKNPKFSIDFAGEF